MMRHNAIILERMVDMLFDCSARGTTEEMYASKDEEVSCNEVANECIAKIQELFPNLFIMFSSDVPDDFCIKTSRHYLGLSIRELLFNAAKYSDGRYVSLSITEAASGVRFIIEDTGPGINFEDSSRLFEMFTKVNELSEGLGIGLALTKRHISNLGGDLILDTSYKAGCRIFIDLP